MHLGSEAFVLYREVLQPLVAYYDTLCTCLEFLNDLEVR